MESEMTLEEMIEAKARILLSNVFHQVEKFKDCGLKFKLQEKIGDIFQLLDEYDPADTMGDSGK